MPPSGLLPEPATVYPVRDKVPISLRLVLLSKQADHQLLVAPTGGAFGKIKTLAHDRIGTSNQTYIEPFCA